MICRFQSLNEEIFRLQTAREQIHHAKAEAHDSNQAYSDEVIGQEIYSESVKVVDYRLVVAVATGDG